VHVVGAEAISTSLDKQDLEGDRVRSGLRQLFCEESAPGVTDIVGSLGANLGDDERALLIRAVLDTFEPLL
jgi:hypothetical protein